MINPKFILSKKTTEKKDQKRGRNVSRRQFVKVATGTAAIIGLVLASPFPSPQAKAAKDKNLKYKAKVTPAERRLAARRTNALLARAAIPAVLDPGGIPHYFGPYANYANSPLPTGSITDVQVTSGGSGYTAPVVAITDAYNVGTGATATATVVGGTITGIIITNPGVGYAAPIVTVTDPDASATGATATAPIGGVLTGGLRKFVDSLPGLGPAGANNLGQYIPVAVPDTITYPGCDYYEIGLVQYR